MVIEVRNLVKRFGSFTAVDGLSFDVKRGDIFSFLGTNGAGKSTSISCMTTLLAFDRGEIVINGRQVGVSDREIRSDIGVVFQSSVLDPLLTVRENLRLRAQFYGLDRAQVRARIDELSAMIELESFLDRRYGPLSGGQKRRADIARALLHQPSVLFLDEPTAGLDPQSREHVWDTVRQLRDDAGLTLFLTTHYMEETEQSDRVLVIDAGRPIASGTPGELRRTYSSSVLSVVLDDDEHLDRVCAEYAVEACGGDIRVQGADVARGIINRLGSSLIDFEYRHGNMDDVFLALTSERSGA